ncbi:hypothetical protein C7212DRAFT_348608 [Tuber magnatum]|uniref:Uncharacterized protein n=1 Tax=Tuber magnatum TaxID=42249 RepID=A0A317SBZ6_9PEZI|nr:hypothetical protein C7212DRAFT_348608 [Tuber magnatum]
MATPYQGNILYYPLPNGTLVPLLDVNGRYVPASSYPRAIPVNIAAILEPVAPRATANTTAGQPPTPTATTTAAQPTPQQQQQQQPPCVIMFLQKDGSYGLKPDS